MVFYFLLINILGKINRHPVISVELQDLIDQQLIGENQLLSRNENESTSSPSGHSNTHFIRSDSYVEQEQSDQTESDIKNSLHTILTKSQLIQETSV